MLAVYRKFCASSSASGQLILPESLKLLPLFGLSLTKATALRAGTDVTVDERSARIAQACRLSVSASLSCVYPTLYAIPLDGELPALPPPTVALSSEKLQHSSVYLLDSGLQMFLWFGSAVERAVIEQLVGPASLKGLDCSSLELRPAESGRLAATVRAAAAAVDLPPGPRRGRLRPRRAACTRARSPGPTCARATPPLCSRARAATHLPPVSPAQAHAVIRSLGSQRGGHYPRVQITSAENGADLRFLAMLTEDRSQAAMSYVEFLCHIHRQIQVKIT